MNSFELYRVAGKPVFLPHLVIGLALTALLTVMNYRGIRMSASFQNVTTFGAIALVATFILAGLRHGSTQNLQPLFSASAPLSILLVLQIVPYFMTGFESIGKASEEANSQFQSRRFLLGDHDSDARGDRLLRVRHRRNRIRGAVAEPGP